MSRARGTRRRVSLLAACAAWLVALGAPCWVDVHVSAEQRAHVHLTHTQPRTVMAVPEEALQRAPALLLVPVTHIENETLTPVSLYAYLTWNEPKGGARLERLLLGQVSIFPANQPGTFTIRLSQEFQDLLTRAPGFRQLSPSLVLELRPIHSRPLPPMDLTIGPVEWRIAEETPTS